MIFSSQISRHVLRQMRTNELRAEGEGGRLKGHTEELNSISFA